MANQEKDIFMETNVASIPNFQITGEVSTNKHPDLTKTIDPGLLAILTDIRDQNHTINQKLDVLTERQNTTDKKIDACASEFKKACFQLEKENSVLRNKLEFLEKENELLYRQVNFQNLILIGLPEVGDESAYDLFSRVSEIINSITETEIKIDTVYRIGRLQSESQRPIRIRFFAHSDRNFVYECREHLKEGMTLNEDLPFRVRQDLFALRKKRAELFQDKIKHTINWKTKTISISDGPDITVKDGKLIPVSHSPSNCHIYGPKVNSVDKQCNQNKTIEEDQSPDCSHSDEPPNKKSKKDAPQPFLGKQYSLRSQTTLGRGPPGHHNRIAAGRKPGRGRGNQPQGPPPTG